MFTLCAIFFLAWALISVVGEKLEVERAIVALYGILVVAFLLGVPGATEPDTGFKEWCKFLAYSSGVFFTFASLQRVPNEIERLITGFGVSGLIVLATLYLMLFVHAGDEDFRPNRHMLEDNLPFLTPFILHYLHEQGPKRPAFTVLALLGAIIGYILLSQGRSALLGLVVALGCYGGWCSDGVPVAGTFVIISVLVGSYGNQFVRGAWSRQAAIEMSILTSALFSFSYRSKPFSIYLFIFLAALAFLDQSRRTDP